MKKSAELITERWREGGGWVGENYIKTDEFLNETSDLRSCVKVEVAVLGSCP